MIASLLAVLVLAPPTDLTFVRHGETLANFTGRYTARTIDTFSDNGKAGVTALTKQLLSKPRFDIILVSPSPRALKTIEPYLQATHQTATIWPLLYECCTQATKATRATTFKWGSTIRIPTALSPYFKLMPGETQLPIAPDFASGLAQVEAAVKEFPELCKGKRVLLVGHSGQGGHFLHALTGKWMQLRNATPVQLRLP